MDTVIAIGHENAGPDFAPHVRAVIDRFGTLNAVVSGTSWSPEWGDENATWFAVTFAGFEDYVEARARILAIAAANNQDAVAFTIGDTDVAETPQPARRAYRDLL